MLETIDLFDHTFVHRTYQVVPENPTMTSEEASGMEQKWEEVSLDMVVTDLGNGCVQVSWKVSPSTGKHLVFCYQLLINGNVYCAPFNRVARSCRVFGLEGGLRYAIKLVAVPNAQHLLRKFTQTEASPAFYSIIQQKCRFFQTRRFYFVIC